MTTMISKSVDRGPTVLHILIGTIAGLFILSETFFLHSFNLWTVIESVLLVFIFYIHALVLIPLLIKDKAINKYILLAFGLFALGAVVFSVLRIASWPDSIYIFTKILYHGPAFGSNIEHLYEENFFVALSLFVASFIYGLLAEQTKDKFKYLGSLMFDKMMTESLIHVVLLIVLMVTSYFSGYFFSNTLILSVFLFYFHLLHTSPILLKYKRLNYFIAIVCLEVIVFCAVLSFFTNMQLPFLVSMSITLITFATIYVAVKYRYTEKEYLFAKKESELQQLKSQVNPHFLFNSLNTLYSFALQENAAKTAQAIKKFSDLVRFMLSDLKKDFIPLENEANYIRDYIDIQLARCSSKQNFEVNFMNIEGYRIAPMLLIPFVENAFKHGINPSEESSLFLNLECSNGVIKFECTNSLRRLNQVEAADQGFGIGVENVKSRLALIYPDRHTISIVSNVNEFSVKLEINDNSYRG